MESRHSSKPAYNIQNTKKRLRCAICKYQYVVSKAQMCEFEALTLGMIAKSSSAALLRSLDSTLLKMTYR